MANANMLNLIDVQMLVNMKPNDFPTWTRFKVGGSRISGRATRPTLNHPDNFFPFDKLIKRQCVKEVWEGLLSSYPSLSSEVWLSTTQWTRSQSKKWRQGMEEEEREWEKEKVRHGRRMQGSLSFEYLSFLRCLLSKWSLGSFRKATNP